MAEEQASVEDRIADHFGVGDDEPEIEENDEPEGDEPEAEAPEGEEDESPEPVKPDIEEIEIDGELYEVPAKLKEAFLRQSDYTQKTQSLAAERKEAEVLRATVLQAQKQQEFVQSIQQEAGQLQMLDYQINQYREYMRANVDSLSGNELEKLRFHIEEAKLQKDELTGKLQNKWNEHQQAQQQSEKELLDKSTEVLRSKVSNWSEETEKAITDYARQNGFTDDEVKYARFDPRQLVLAHKAMLYDKLQSGKAAAVKKAESAPPIKAKARNPMPENVKAKLNFKKQIKSAKSDKDKARLIEADLERMFR
jgi:hypothetical protein